MTKFSDVHTAILVKGDTQRYFCKDGLSAIDVFHISQILNFGGKTEFVNCGPKNQWLGMMHSIYSMNE